MDISRLLEVARTNDLYDLIAEALNVLAARERSPQDPDDVLSTSVFAQHAGIYRDEATGRYSVVYYSEASAVDAGIERGTNTDEHLVATYEAATR